MPLRLLALFCLTWGVAQGCSCVAPAVSAKLRGAAVVFRGTIIEILPRPLSQSGAPNDHGLAVFRVLRVWKGEVSDLLVMPAFHETTGCIGFWEDYLKVGTELLVYASGSSQTGYTTGICGGHMLATEGQRDFKELGLGKPPQWPLIPVP